MAASPPPNPSPPQPRRGKLLECTIHLLDNNIKKVYVPPKSLGKTLYLEVVTLINIKDSSYEYFDLEFNDQEGNRCWLDHDKPILRQTSDPTFHFLVKFYTPDPCSIEDEYVKYLFALQIRLDLRTGALVCQEHTAVLLASYIVQADLGDWSDDLYPDHSYLTDLQLLSIQNEKINIKIMEHHREHMGESPAEADNNLLDTARKVDNYGLRFHPAKDHDGTPLSLAVAHTGILVFQNQTRINSLSWGKIRKLSFKKKKFLIKLHPKPPEESRHTAYYKDTLEFYFGSRNQSKNFWKRCIEHHAFFRCHRIRAVQRHKTRIVSRGSSFRYSGRTQRQLADEQKGTLPRNTNFIRCSVVPLSPVSRKSLNDSQATALLVMEDARSTSLRTMTPHTTPKSSTLNSHDLSASSGSHILDQTMEIAQHGGRFEPCETHETVVPMPSGTSSFRGPKRPLGDSGSPITVNSLDPSKFMLSPSDRNRSVPTFSHFKDNGLDFEGHLSRSPELSNIPERVVDINKPPVYDRSSSLTRTVSATAPDHVLPPPPPPILDSPQLPRYESSKTSTSAASMTLTSMSSQGDEEGEDTARRKRFPADKAYFIAKELLMTERTYKKDLEVLTVWFRRYVFDRKLRVDRLTDLLFECLDPVYDFHCGLLKHIETRVHLWEGKANAHLNGDYQRIGDILLDGMKVLQFYDKYLFNLEDVVQELDFTARRNKDFEELYREFEAEKVCYLPLNTFLLKPAQRLMHYQQILQALVDHYGPVHADHMDCQTALEMIQEILLPYEPAISHIENLQKLIELQRDLTGLESLVQPTREFVREGCLQKLSRKGYQQRMFFLFSDQLVYASRMSTPAFMFKVHGQLALKDMVVEDAEQKMAVANSFTIYGGGNRCLLLAASSTEEKDKWLEDLRSAIRQIEEFAGGKDDKNMYPSLKSNSSSECLDETHDECPRSPVTPDRQLQHRTNTTMHVCWHRNTSVSMKDYYLSVQNQISGYLLRKFKNTNGWQKLWVVFTNFCLFFYKSYQDDFPLASLPLLGYSVSTPSEGDGIHKDYVFKLQFKNHVYFFRAESQYTFERWVQVISSATSSAHLLRMFSRIDSH